MLLEVLLLALAQPLSPRGMSTTVGRMVLSRATQASRAQNPRMGTRPRRLRRPLWEGRLDVLGEMYGVGMMSRVKLIKLINQFH
jgi:hypothetical protein